MRLGKISFRWTPVRGKKALARSGELPALLSLAKRLGVMGGEVGTVCGFPRSGFHLNVISNPGRRCYYPINPRFPSLGTRLESFCFSWPASCITTHRV